MKISVIPPPPSESTNTLKGNAKQAISTPKVGKRLNYITWIQFVGVISVIFGHSMNSIDVPDIVLQTKKWVYTYHMPLFFLVSAYLFSHLGGFSHYGGYKGTFSEKFQRLLLPYIIWNAAFFIPKIIMSAYIPETVQFTPEYYIKLLLSPRDNILGHTWFLCALFEMFVLSIAFERIRQHREYWIPLLAILVVINCFGVTNRFFAIGDLMKNAIFFWIGLLLGSVNQDSIEKWAHDSRFYYSVLSLVCVCTCIWIFNHDMLINTLVLGISILFLLGILQIRYNIKFDFMEFVSRNSFCIYILHWPILMVIRFIFYQHFHCTPILAMCLMFVGGIIIASSMAWVLRRFDANPVLKRVNKVVFGL